MDTGVSTMSTTQTINDFAAKDGNGVFPNIPRADVAKGLRTRASDADTIYQDRSSLCGPATLCWSILRKRPEMYVDYVTSVYDTGEGVLGDLKVKPGSDCRSSKLNGKISAVDWVSLASIRDSENSVFDYQSTDNEFSGITMPNHLESWMKKTGHTGVKNKTNIWATKDIDNLEEAADLCGKGYTVALFLWANLLEGYWGGWTTVPDHWISMTRAPVFKGGKVVDLGFWTWAKRWNINSSIERWESGHFGYVAGKLK